MKKTNIAFVLSITAIVGVLAISLLWIIGCIKLSVVSLDSFVGVIVALLAIIVTVAIGWQIVNAIDVRDKIRELEHRQHIILDNERKLVENGDNYVKLVHNMQAGLLDSSTDAYLSKGLSIYAFGSAHSALHHAILAGQSGLDGRIKKMQNIVGLITAIQVVNFDVLRNQIEKETDAIRQTEEYAHFFSNDYEQIMAAFWTKMSELGLTS